MIVFDLILHELVLFAAVGFLIIGVNEAAIDIIWLARFLWRRLFIFTRHDRATVATLPPPRASGTIAVLIAAWDESAVIGTMLTQLTNRFAGRDYHVIIGAYPNDPATIAAIEAVQSDRITLARNRLPGPTTKAQCLNEAWRTLLAIEAERGTPFKAIALHDAEDLVHRSEIAVYDSLIERIALVQLPVYPMVDRRSRWIGGHYCDEFAEAHGKALIVRELIGAAVPAAGVGCAVERTMMGRIAALRGGEPFNPQSLTEDYELGLHIRSLGGKTALVRVHEAPGAPVVAVRAHFPGTLETAVRQKTRWMIGIALAGWDRLGWQSGALENWMRLRDRIAPLAAVILLAGYVGMIGLIVRGLIIAPRFDAGRLLTPVLIMMLQINAVLVVWRLIVRCGFVTHDYGWREGLRSIPRIVIANVIAIMAARRAIGRYLRMQRANQVQWDKTDHIFPDIGEAS